MIACPHPVPSSHSCIDIKQLCQALCIYELMSLLRFSLRLRRSTRFLCIFSAIFSYRSFSALASRLSLIACTRLCSIANPVSQLGGTSKANGCARGELATLNIPDALPPSHPSCPSLWPLSPQSPSSLWCVLQMMSSQKQGGKPSSAHAIACLRNHIISPKYHILTA